MKNSWPAKKIISKTLNYGCYCKNARQDSRLLQAIETVRGLPIDDIDITCKNLYQCYECQRMDQEDTFQKCDPANVKYTADFSVVADDAIESNTNKVCKDPIGTCERSICECDKTFSVNYAKFFKAKNVFSKYHVHGNSKNNFDYKSDHFCAWPADLQRNLNTQNLKCCGRLGNRFLYDASQSKQCCQHDGKTYNPFISDCCEIGGVQGVGGC